MSDRITESLQVRHAAFWAMEEVEASLLSVGRYYPLQPRQPIPLAEGMATEGMPLTSERIDPERLIALHEELELLLEVLSPRGLCLGVSLRGKESASVQ
jgi:hypothetical protein